MSLPNPPAASVCPQCGKVHPRCAAHKRGQPDTPCGSWPISGGTVCRYHGGNVPATRDAATRRKAQAEVFSDKRFRPLLGDVNPAEQLIDLIRYQSGVVNYWRERVEALSDEELVFGKVKEVTTEKPQGTFTETVESAQPAVAYRMMREAQKDLADFCTAALKAGIEERQVRVAEQQGALFAGALRSILGKMFDVVMSSLRSQGLSDVGLYAQLTDGWTQAMGTVVPQEMRAIQSRVESKPPITGLVSNPIIPPPDD